MGNVKMKNVKGARGAGRVAGAALAAFAVGAPLAAAGVNAVHLGAHVGEVGSAYAESSPEGVPVMAGEKMFVYVKAGEHLHIKAQDGFVSSVQDPDGKTVTVPESGDFPAAEKDGVWSVSTNRYVGEGQDAVRNGVKWNIGAVDASGAEKHGRVWAERVGVRQWWEGDFSENSLGTHASDITLWTVTDTGYLYKLQFKGYNGLESVITATSSGINKKSVVDGKTVYSPTNQSYNDWKITPDSGYDAYAPNGGSADVTNWLSAKNFNEAPSSKLYKLFFERPADDLPESIVPAYKALSDPTVKWRPDAEGSTSGYLEISGLDAGVTYEVTAGGKSAEFIGTTEATMRVDAGNVDDVKWSIKARSSSQIHTMLNDVERFGGITITQENGPTKGDSTVYWDDSTFTPPSHPAKPTSAVSALEGVASDTPSGVHGWLAPDDGTDLGNDNNTYGDGRIVDTWANSGEAKEWNGSIPVKPQNPHISIVKTVREPEYAEGDTLNWDFKVTNDGETILNDVKVVEDEYTGTNPLTDVSCPKTTLAIGESMMCSATSVASAKDVDADKIENTAHPEGSDPGGKRVKGDPSKAVTTPKPKPKPNEEKGDPHISIVKTVDESAYKAGDTLHWKFKVTNDGKVDLTDVTVVEDAYTGTGKVENLSCPKTTLAVDESMDCSATSVATDKDAEADMVENTAHPEGNDPSGKRVKGDPSKAVTKPEPKPQTPPTTPPTTPPAPVTPPAPTTPPATPPAPQENKPAALPVTGASVALVAGGVALLAGGGAAGVTAARRRGK